MFWKKRFLDADLLNTLKYCKNSQINDALLFWNNVIYSYLDSLKSKFLILNSLDFIKVQCLLTFNIVLVNGIMYT